MRQPCPTCIARVFERLPGVGEEDARLLAVLSERDAPSLDELEVEPWSFAARYGTNGLWFVETFVDKSYDRVSRIRMTGIGLRHFGA